MVSKDALLLIGAISGLFYNAAACKLAPISKPQPGKSKTALLRFVNDLTEFGAKSREKRTCLVRADAFRCVKANVGGNPSEWRLL